MITKTLFLNLNTPSAMLSVSGCIGTSVSRISENNLFISFINGKLILKTFKLNKQMNTDPELVIVELFFVCETMSWFAKLGLFITCDWFW